MIYILDNSNPKFINYIIYKLYNTYIHIYFNYKLSVTVERNVFSKLKYLIITQRKNNK